MATCKHCGCKCGFLAGLGSGLCRDCSAKAASAATEEANRKEEERRQEAIRKEEERKKLVLEGAKKNIDAIVNFMTEETPLCYSFIIWDFSEKKTGFIDKAPKLLLGLAVGGPIGQMVFGGTLLSESTCAYSGELGVIVVLPKQIRIAHFTTFFPCGDGRILPDHLDLFRAQIEAKTIQRKTFSLRQTHFTLSQFPSYNAFVRLESGDENVSFQRSSLYVNGDLFETPGQADLQKQVAQLKTLITPSEFVEKLLSCENPVSEYYVQADATWERYLDKVFNAIMMHRHRDVLFHNFSCLISPVKEGLESRMRAKVSSVYTLILKNVSLGLIAIGIVSGFLVFFHCSVGWIIGVGTVCMVLLGMGIFYDDGVRQSMWCRNPKKSNRVPDLVNSTVDLPASVVKKVNTEKWTYQWYFEALKKGVIFNGRARRKEFWMFSLFNIIIYCFIVYISQLVDKQWILTLYDFMVLFPVLAVTARRMQDSDSSWLWSFVPLVNLIFACIKGTTGDNQYGPDPKANS